MKVTVKIITILLLTVVMITAINSTVFALTSANSIIDGIEKKANETPTDAAKISEIAGKILALIQYAAVAIGVVLIAVMGFKFMMGSAEEKAEYKKSFVPFIVGVVVIFAATALARLIFSTFA